MKTRLFYIFLSLIIISFSGLLFLLNSNINLTFITNFFSKQSIDVESFLCYAQGNEIFFSIKNYNAPIEYNTKITNNMTIITGKESLIAFYIKRQGIYYLYPESTLYIEKIENFNKMKSIKETHLILEKGKAYFNLNLFSDNSIINIETDTISLLTQKAEFQIEKIEDLKTLVLCFNDSLYFRPFSNKFELLKRKRIYSITNSVERLISYSNILQKNEKVVIDYENCVNLDMLLSRIYESRNLTLINKEYITKNLVFKKEEIKSNPIKPELFFNEQVLDENYGYLEFKIPNIRYSIFFNDKELSSNNRYIFLLKEGLYPLIYNIGFTNLEKIIKIQKNIINSLQVRNYTGIKNLLINNQSVKISVLNPEEVENKFRIVYQKNKNYQIIEIENPFKKIESINIISDLDIKTLHLFENNKNDSAEYIVEKNSEKYYSFPFNTYNSKEIFIDKINYSKDILLVEYNNNYQLE